MKQLLCVLALMAMGFARSAWSGDFEDTFDTSQYWYRTGGTGDGTYDAVSGAYMHTGGEHCSYYRYDPLNCSMGNGIYSFDVYGPYWEVAWKVTSTNPSHGWTRRLGNYPNWWSGYFMRPYAEWYGAPYAWQNAEGYTLHNYGGPDPSGSHHITIEDSDMHVAVWIDDVLIFDVDVESLPDGTVGLGCGDIQAVEGTPSYDNMAFLAYSHVHRSTWASIKALL